MLGTQSQKVETTSTTTDTYESADNQLRRTQRRLTGRTLKSEPRIQLASSADVYSSSPRIEGYLCASNDAILGAYRLSK